MIKLIETIADALEVKKFTTALFLDFSKAFDCLSHDLIISKLETLGIKGAALKWFGNYLQERFQLVEIKTTMKGTTKTLKSKLSPVKRGSRGV